MAHRLRSIYDHLFQGSGSEPFLEVELTSADGNIEVITITEERAKANFVGPELTHILFGGAERSNLRKRIFDEIGNDPIFQTQTNVDDLETGAFRELTMARVKRFLEMEFLTRDQDEARMAVSALQQICPSTGTRYGVGLGLFSGSVLNNGTEYHKEKFERAMQLGKVLGCFAMTELGHGSNASGLETTATFNKDTDEFTIHSPTLTSTKWWIGGAAQTATHAVVFARLILGSVDHGVHSFVVQLRDPQDHSPMPGITVGDCGEKLGLNGTDNGYIRFNQVRIPRQMMLNRYANVDRDGTYTKASKESLALQRVALVGARASIVGQSANNLFMALTIAIRYGAIRRQFGDSQQETQILNYVTHQMRLFPPLASAFAMHCAGMKLGQNYLTLLKELQNKNFSSLADMHAMTAGLKAICSWATRDGVIICRDCCGGHGYSAYNRLGRIIKDFQVQTTWDGDNTVLCLQTARHVISSFEKGIKGKTLNGSVAYLSHIKPILASRFQGNSSEELHVTANLIAALRYRATNMCREISEKMRDQIQDGTSPADAWSSCLADLVHLAKAHCELYILDQFNAVVEEAKGRSPYNVLRELCNLYAFRCIDQDMGQFRNDDYVSSVQGRMIRAELQKTCAKIRPNAVALVDAFALPDFAIDSQIGRSDGDIYNHYMERVKEFPLKERAHYWEQLIKPLTHSSKL
eukprot:TRINITY_DN2053_c0_g1_i1.p1 TRINITY_DN2053_c0_g1~~TRINITY_DN2053_c0_g1_i1.p1  ORF type:complete len:694 (+),score=147.07 TRINITY_DN2053_c0_g1_i1:48-2129(+)